MWLFCACSALWLFYEGKVGSWRCTLVHWCSCAKSARESTLENLSNKAVSRTVQRPTGGTKAPGRSAVCLEMFQPGNCLRLGHCTSLLKVENKPFISQTLDNLILRVRVAIDRETGWVKPQKKNPAKKSPHHADAGIGGSFERILKRCSVTFVAGSLAQAIALQQELSPWRNLRSPTTSTPKTRTISRMCAPHA